MHPIRERVLRALEKKRGSANSLTGDAKALVARVKDNPLGALLSDSKSTAPLLGELVAWGVTVADLVADDGCAVSLPELVAAGTVKSFADLQALQVTIGDILGPHSTPTRRARLNPTLLVQTWPTGVVNELKQSLSIKTICDKYSTHLTPSDFRALGIAFDVELPNNVLKQLYTDKVLKGHPYADWVRDAGLDTKSLAILYPNQPLVNVKKRLQWE